jgi:DedD protein
MIKSRAASQAPSPTPPPQSIDALRRRARHRLIGASMLVLVGVVGFSLLFDTQPRPIAVDIPIEIPAKTAPVAAPAASKAPEAPSVEKSIEKAAEQAPEPVAAAKPVETPAQPEPEKAVAVAPPADPPPVLAPAVPNSTGTGSKATPSSTESGSGDASNGSDGGGLRLVVQVGAFAETSRAQEVRQKIERAGMKTYTHVAQTSQGKRIRVRLGPYSNRAEAEKAASRVKALGYPAAILTL